MPNDSANLDLPYVMQAQAQKHVTVNETLRRLDGVVQLVAQSRSLAAQPSSPTDGAVWIVPAGATGADWSGYAADGLAYFRDGAFENIAPRVGWRAWVADENALLVYDGARWRAAGNMAADTPFGAATLFRVDEGEVTLSGAASDAPVSIPDRAIVLAVSTRTTEAVTGASSYDCGVPNETNKYGGALSVAEGATNSGVTGPTAFYAVTPVRLTANGSDFTGGKVRVAIHYVLCQPPAG